MPPHLKLLQRSGRSAFYDTRPCANLYAGLSSNKTGRGSGRLTFRVITDREFFSRVSLLRWRSLKVVECRIEESINQTVG